MIKSAEDIPAVANGMRLYQPVTPSQSTGPVDFWGFHSRSLCDSIEDVEPLCNGNDWGLGATVSVILAVVG